MQTVIETGFAEAKRRDPELQAEWVVLVDGDLTQLDDIEQAACSLGVEVVIILDIIHGLEYLWKAGKAWLPPDDPNIAQWICDKISQVLQGKAAAHRPRPGSQQFQVSRGPLLDILQITVRPAKTQGSLTALSRTHSCATIHSSSLRRPRRDAPNC